MLFGEIGLYVWAGFFYFIDIYNDLKSLWIPHRKRAYLPKDSFSGMELHVNDCFYYSYEKEELLSSLLENGKSVKNRPYTKIHYMSYVLTYEKLEGADFKYDNSFLKF